MVEQIRDVKRTLDLFSQNLLHAWMVVTQRIDADARQQVEITLVRRIDQIGAASAFDKNVVARVRSENVFLLEFFDV